MSNPLFDLKATHNPHRYYLPISPEITVGPPDRKFMFGGVGLAAAIEAMQRTTGRPAIWATAQYLSFARPGSVVDLDVWVPTEGRFNSQARVVGHVDDKEIIIVTAALGSRPDETQGQWVRMPEVPPPLDCPLALHWSESRGAFRDHFEKRLALGRFPSGERLDGPSEDGRVCTWVRMRDGQLIGSALLAVIADFVIEAASHATGRLVGGNSLDNTIRYARVVPSEWVLCDMRIEAVRAGVAHAAMRLFAEGGTLLATASQSLILRYHGER